MLSPKLFGFSQLMIDLPREAEAVEQMCCEYILLKS